jgi:hopanoid biosynthesis associated RND transporter like protein HpnN
LRSPLVVLGSWSFRHPWKLLCAALLACSLSVGLASQRLTLETDWLVLFSPDLPEIKALRLWRQNLPAGKDIAVIVSGGELKARQRAVDQLGLTLRNHPEHLESPLYSLNSEKFLRSGLYYLPKEQLVAIDNDVRALLGGVDSRVSQAPLQLERLTSSLVKGDPGSELVLRFLKALEESTRDDTAPADAKVYWPEIAPESPKIREILDAFTSSAGERVYLSLDGGQSLLVLVSPKTAGQGGRAEDSFRPAVATVRQLLATQREQYPQLTFSLTGEPVLVVDERQTIAEDSVVSTSLSLVLVLLLFHFGYREVTRPMLALVTLMVGLAWTLGAVALLVGHLNFISVTYIPILVGIGIDFGIHVSFRYFECRRESDRISAIETTMATAGKYTLIAAVTNCVPFGILVLVGFRGVAELGLIAMIGVIFCQLASCSVLPALLGLLEQRSFRLPDRGRQDLGGWFDGLQSWGGSMLALTAVTTMLCCLSANRAGFEIHLLKMQNPQLESVQTELMLVASGKSSVLTALVPAANLEQARDLEDKLRAMPSVAEVIALSTFLPRVEDGEELLVKELLDSRAQLMGFLTGLAGIPPLEAAQALRLFGVLDQVPEGKPLSAQIRAVGDQLQRRLQRRGPGPLLDAVNELVRQLEVKSTEVSALLKLQEQPPLRPEQLPAELLARLRGVDGTFVLRVFPRSDIWQSPNLHAFLRDLRSVSPQVSGEPVLIELFERVVLRTHRYGVVLSAVAMTIILLVVLRDIRLVALAGLPTVFSLVQVLGFMGIFGLSFNPANFVAVPMLLGVGSVFGLQSVLRMKELGNSRVLCCSTGLAIMLSAATSAAGFASLGVASHRGIASLGGLVTLGLVLNAVLSLFVLPIVVSRYPDLMRCRAVGLKASADER